MDDSESELQEELRAIDTRQHGGQLVLVRNNGVVPRPSRPIPIVQAVRVQTPPIATVLETPPRQTRRAFRTAPTAAPRQVQAIIAAEERIGELQDENQRLKRDLRVMRTERRTMASMYEDSLNENERLKDELDALRKRQRVLPAPEPVTTPDIIDLSVDDEEKDEFPLDDPEVYRALPVELPECEKPGAIDNVVQL